MKFIHITDTHLADKALGNRKSTYPFEMKNKIQEVVDLCIEERRHLIHTGDFFQHKEPHRNTHAMNIWLMRQFKRLWEADLSVFGILGNHDLGPAGVNSVDKQPIGVLQESEFVVFIDGLYDFKDVLLVGFPYDEAGEFDPTYFDAGRPSKSRPSIYLTHGSIVPDDVVKMYPTIKYSEIAKSSYPDLVLCGHIHDDYGFQRVNDTWFSHFGSLSRNSRTQRRKVRVGKIDTEGKNVYIEPYELKSALPFDEIFLDLSLTQQLTLDPELAKLAQETLSIGEMENLDYQAVLDEIVPTLDEVTRSKVLYYIDQAEQVSFR